MPLKSHFLSADKLSRNGLSLPTFPALTDDEIDRICELF
jgi:dTDP-4-amino-4,6-dideoxygalactose transaminase